MCKALNVNVTHTHAHAHTHSITALLTAVRLFLDEQESGEEMGKFKTRLSD